MKKSWVYIDMATKVTADNLGAAISVELQYYDMDLQEQIKKAVDIEALATKKDVISVSIVSDDYVYKHNGKIHSPGDIHTGGRYKKGWKSKKAFIDGKEYHATIYNSSQYWRVHLLENGRNGGIGARPHIAGVQERASERLTARIEDIIGSW